MKTVTFDQARTEFEQVFQLAAGGETVVIQRDAQRVALHRLADRPEPDIPPPGYFSGDYSREQIAELNTAARRTPQDPPPRSKAPPSLAY